jgi:protein-S-isoprenylcysteine O-methyltransferase Ste14
LALLIRAVLFTVLVPGTVTVWLPEYLFGDARVVRHAVGWIPIALGTALYAGCLAQFIWIGRGTPNISFSKPVEFVIGNEPRRFVAVGVYRYTRNPMYLAIVTTLVGEAVLFGSRGLLAYAAVVWIWYHFVVVVIEEPHLRRTRGAGYEQYLHDVPRWLGASASSRPR